MYLLSTFLYTSISLALACFFHLSPRQRFLIPETSGLTTTCGLLNSRAQCVELLEGLRIVAKHDMLQGTPAQSTRPRECSDSFQLTKMSVTTWHTSSSILLLLPHNEYDQSCTNVRYRAQEDHQGWGP